VRSRWVARFVSGAVALGLALVLALAALLEPSPAGHGTHTQLGLANCTFLELTGQPCPMCGATTSWALLAHFALVRGVVNQPFAALLFGLAVAAFGVAVAEALDPRDRWSRIARWMEPREGFLAAGFLVLMALGWVYKMMVIGSA